MDNLNKEISYIQVLAKVNFEKTKEFLLYKPLGIIEEISPLKYNTEKKSFKGNAENAIKVQKYKLKFDNINAIPKYIKVELISGAIKIPMVLNLYNNIQYFLTHFNL